MNLEKEEIGYDAHKIYQILDNSGDMRISELKTISKMDTKNVFLALGWLARENKIAFFKLKQDLAVCLIY